MKTRLLTSALCFTMLCTALQAAAQSQNTDPSAAGVRVIEPTPDTTEQAGTVDTLPESETQPTPTNVEPRNFESCAQAAEAGYVNIQRGTPGYHTRLDQDGDGVACEEQRDTRFGLPPTTAPTSRTGPTRLPGRYSTKLPEGVVPTKPGSNYQRHTKSFEQCLNNTDNTKLHEDVTPEEYCTCFVKVAEKQGVLKAYGQCRQP